MKAIGELVELHSKHQSLPASQGKEEQNKAKFTGKYNTCNKCGMERPIFNIPSSKNGLGFITRHNPCECDLAEIESQKKALAAEYERGIKDKITHYFPLSDDIEIEGLEFSKFIKFEGTEEAFNLCYDFAHNFHEPNWRSTGFGILLIGPNGNGKTRLVKTIINHRKRWNTCISTRYDNLCSRILTAYKNKQENPEELYTCLANAGILLIDEIGFGGRNIEFEKILLRIIEDRKRLKKPILFTMNAEGEANLTGTIISKIKGICLPEINEGEDKRSYFLQKEFNELKGDK